MPYCIYKEWHPIGVYLKFVDNFQSSIVRFTDRINFKRRELKNIKSKRTIHDHLCVVRTLNTEEKAYYNVSGS